MRILSSVFFWPLYSWIFISVFAPTHVASNHFVHIQEKDALRISISKNSPPIAAISDDLKVQISFEPKEEIKLDKNDILLTVQNNNSWKVLKKYSDYFEKEQTKQKEIKQKAEALITRFRAEDLKNQTPMLNVPAPSDYIEVAPVINVHYKIKDLIRLVEPVKDTYVAQPDPVQIVATGVKTEEGIVTTKSIHNEVANKNKLWTINQNQQNIEIIKKETQLNTVTQASRLKSNLAQQEIHALDGGDPNQNILIKGQVELSGGLALVEDHSKLRVFWKTALQENDAIIDANTGKFLLNIENTKAGKLVAQLLTIDKKVLGHGVLDLSENDNNLSDLKILIEPLESAKGGEVISAYSYEKVKMLVQSAEVFGPAQTREAVDYKGIYKLAQLGGASTYMLQAHAPDHWPTQMLVEAAKKQSVVMFPNKMLQNFFDIIKQQDNASEYGIIWGKVTKRNRAIANAEVKISQNSSAIGPIYFNEMYIPDLKLTKTSSNGLFAFVKVNPGLHVVYSKFENHYLPSTVLYANNSTVSYVEVQAKALELKGILYDPVFKHKVNATMSVIGNDQQWSVSAHDGFNTKIPSQDSVVHINFYPGSEYYITREAVARSEAKNIEALALRKAFIYEELRKVQLKQEDSLGLAYGIVKGSAFNVYVENEKISDDNILYFNEQGQIDVSKSESGPQGGAFLITNLKPGLQTLVVKSSDGQITNTKIFVSEAGVVNTFSLELRN